MSRAAQRHLDRIDDARAELMAELFPNQDFRDDIFDQAHHTVRTEITKCAATGDKAGEMSRLERLCESWIENRLHDYCDQKDLTPSEAADRIRYLYTADEKAA